MSALVSAAASPAVPGEHASHALARAARRLGWTKGRVKSFWYGKGRESPEELEAAREVAVKHTKDVELLRAEHRRAVEILARLETRLAAIDPDFYGPDIGAYRDMAGGAAGAGDAVGLTPAAPDGEGGR